MAQRTAGEQGSQPRAKQVGAVNGRQGAAIRVHMLEAAWTGYTCAATVVPALKINLGHLTLTTHTSPTSSDFNSDTAFIYLNVNE